MTNAYLDPRGHYQCRTCRAKASRRCLLNAKPLTVRGVLASAKRFWSYVKRGARNACWPWRGAHSRKTKYGYFSYGGKPRRAHAIAFVLGHRRLPRGIVCHTCDNPPCCNPKHGYDGTDATNARDRAVRGRTARGRRSGPYTKPQRFHRGENTARAKVSDRAVLYMRRLHAHGNVSYVALGRRFGVSGTQARNIVQGRRYPWIGRKSPWRKFA